MNSGRDLGPGPQTPKLRMSSSPAGAVTSRSESVNSDDFGLYKEGDWEVVLEYFSGQSQMG